MIKTWGNILCAIDTETTGLDCSKHEIIEICILPLTNGLELYTEILPFHMFLKPYGAIDEDALKVNKRTLKDILAKGTDPYIAADMFDEWFSRLPIGDNKRILPIGQNYQFDMGFIKRWLGETTYNDCFHYHYRDSMISANFLNDRADLRVEVRPFDKINLTELARNLKIPLTHAHSALDDCVATAKVYKRLVEMFTFP